MQNRSSIFTEHYKPRHRQHTTVGLFVTLFFEPCCRYPPIVSEVMTEPTKMPVKSIKSIAMPCFLSNGDPMLAKATVGLIVDYKHVSFTHLIGFRIVVCTKRS